MSALFGELGRLDARIGSMFSSNSHSQSFSPSYHTYHHYPHASYSASNVPAAPLPPLVYSPVPRTSSLNVPFFLMLPVFGMFFDAGGSSMVHESTRTGNHLIEHIGQEHLDQMIETLEDDTWRAFAGIIRNIGNVATAILIAETAPIIATFMLLSSVTAVGTFSVSRSMLIDFAGHAQELKQDNRNGI